ncbi:hypothetical protein [Kingella oralis]|uniref:tetratricopeptide repeat protein n=1 Tax=Kingella oralis TaxID=505 RepID=UPI002D7F303F|nr:hypothetical protein [Kingella oralis]
MNRLFLTTFILATAACATPPTTPPPRQPETLPIASSLPYPETTANEQFEQLAIQVSRLENQVAELHERVEQLEQRIAASAKRPTRVRVNKPIAPPFQGSLKTENAPSLLEKAQQQYRAQQYQAATATLREADSGGDGSESAQKSMFLLLQSHQKLNHCQSVINIGQRYAARFSGSPNAPEALSLVAQCQWRIQQQDIARDTWRKIIQQYTKSPAAARARNQIHKK